VNLTCDELRALLLEHHAGELAVEQTQSFESHLVRCRDCTYYVESYTHTVKITGRLPKSGLPADVESRMREALKEQLK